MNGRVWMDGVVWNGFGWEFSMGWSVGVYGRSWQSINVRVTVALYYVRRLGGIGYLSGETEVLCLRSKIRWSSDVMAGLPAF